MITSADIVKAARSWLGTPYLHQARLKGIGVDCAGLVIGVANELGISNFDVSDYGMQPDPAKMGDYLSSHLDRIPITQLCEGDILWLRVEEDPQHLAIVTAMLPRIMIAHAFAFPAVQKCVEHGAGNYWQDRITACYRYRGIA